MGPGSPHSARLPRRRPSPAPSAGVSFWLLVTVSAVLGTPPRWVGLPKGSLISGLIGLSHHSHGLSHQRTSLRLGLAGPPGCALSLQHPNPRQRSC